MNQAIQKIGLYVFVCLLAAGCHSSTPTPAPAAQNTVAAPQPAPAPVAAPPAAPKALVCTGTTNGDDAAFVETSSLYTVMNSKLGWSSCVEKKLSKTDDETTVTFVGGATLTVSLFPSSDGSAQEAVLPAGTSVTADDAIKALKGSMPADGCGVNWSKLSAGGPNATGDFKASGKSCTADLHVKMLKGSVVGFGFSQAS